jgi:capsular exopolysaccharide synthesis family protein
MSRIFDALQRSESERASAEGATLPEGPELLRYAEHVELSNREGSVALTDSIVTTAGDDYDGGGRTSSARSQTAAMPVSHVEGRFAQQHAKILSQFPSLEVSVPPQSRLVCLTDRENPTAEAIRLLGVRLKDLRRTRPLKKLLITSTIPQEGKSMIAANLACSLAYALNARVLLVDGDLRRPSLSHMFGIQEQSGVYEWLREERDLMPNIRRLEDAGIWILPAGHASSNPIELLQSQRLPALLDQVAALFDWIIIDSPPVLPLADTSVWIRLTDGILLVTRQGTTEKQQLKKGLEALRSDKVIGALVNGTMASAYSGYYYRSNFSSQ